MCECLLALTCAGGDLRRPQDRMISCHSLCVVDVEACWLLTHLFIGEVSFCLLRFVLLYIQSPLKEEENKTYVRKIKHYVTRMLI